MPTYNANVDFDYQNSSYTFCCEHIANSGRVLEAGCAAGHFGGELFKKKNCEIFGVDYNKDFLTGAAEKNAYKRLFRIDLNNLSGELDEYKGYFDYIVMTDVIEHLYNPGDVVNKLKSFLNENGYFLFSIPNISHGSIKLKLFRNEFNYTKEGLLDNTHIRFFTLKSIIGLMNSLNLEITDLFRIYKKFDETNQELNLREFPVFLLNIMEKDHESYAFQYALKVKPGNTENNHKYLAVSVEKRIKYLCLK